MTLILIALLFVAFALIVGSTYLMYRTTRPAMVVVGFGVLLASATGLLLDVCTLSILALRFLVTGVPQ